MSLREETLRQTSDDESETVTPIEAEGLLKSADTYQPEQFIQDASYTVKCVFENNGEDIVQFSEKGTSDSTLMVPYSGPTSHKSLETNPTGSWLEGSDSCPSVSPSPGPDGGEPFEFNDVTSLSGATEELSAALQAEREFLDFMCSLPQVQESVPKILNEIHQDPPPPKEEVTSLDHLGHLCRVVEQLAELKEQNMRLQKRVQYLEDVRRLHQIHRQMGVHRKETEEPSALRYKEDETVRQVDQISDLRSEDLRWRGDRGGGGQRLLRSSVTSQPFTSTDDCRRRDTVGDPSVVALGEKYKKEHKSAWGKVKHIIINTRKDAKKLSIQNRDKMCENLRRGTSYTNTVNQSNINNRGAFLGDTHIASSDPEDYDIDCNQMYITNDSDQECDIAGIWIGPKFQKKECVAAAASSSVDSTGKSLHMPVYSQFPTEKDYLIHQSQLPNMTTPNIRLTPTTDSSWDTSPQSTNASPPRKETIFLPDQTKIDKINKIKPNLTITVPSAEDIPSMTMEEDSSDLAHSTDGLEKMVQHHHSQHNLDGHHKSHQENVQHSHWEKVKNAFITSSSLSVHHKSTTDGGCESGSADNRDDVNDASSGYSQPPSPNTKASFIFEEDLCSLQLPSRSHSRQSSGGLRLPSGSSLSAGSSPPVASHTIISAGGSMGRNLVDFQKALSGEFNKKIHEWERIKGGQLWLYNNLGSGASFNMNSPTKSSNTTSATSEDNLPHEFRKKLQEWEKIKEKEKGASMASAAASSSGLASQYNSSTADENKTKKLGEDSLPPEFKKKLTEWEIGKVLAGKSQQNVEELQKKLGEEFNKKMVEWERIKAASTHTMSNTAQDSQAQSGDSLSSGVLDPKMTLQKVKKIKAKPEKQTTIKAESQSKHRDKDIQWLERELNKIEREKQRLEKEKEKYIEREARLERMWQAYQTGHSNKKEVLIKTSTGEFRFEGISQTFTKRLYEWEERKGIRPESSTIALLAPDVDVENDCTAGGTSQNQQWLSEINKLGRCKSESSVAELATTNGGIPVISSSGSLNSQDLKAASVPTLVGDESASTSEVNKKIFPTLFNASTTSSEHNSATVSSIGDKVLSENNLNEPHKIDGKIKEKGEVKELETKLKGITRRRSSVSRQSSGRSISNKTAYAPAEITRLIDSSDSEEDRIHQSRYDGEFKSSGVKMLKPPKGLRASDSLRSESSYQDLLQENMTLLEQLRNQEVVCRVLQTKMGDIDSKMDSVTDQHIKTLEKLHQQVTILKDSVATGYSQFDNKCDDYPECNQPEAVTEASREKPETLDLESVPEGDCEKQHLDDKADDDSSSQLNDEQIKQPDLLNNDVENKMLIEKLKERITELELKGETLQLDKEKLEASFQVHKERENNLAQFLLLKMRDLQVAEADLQNTILTADEKQNGANKIDEAEMESDSNILSAQSNGSIDDIGKQNSAQSTESSSENVNSSLKSTKRKMAFRRQDQVQEEETNQKTIGIQHYNVNSDLDENIALKEPRMCRSSGNVSNAHDDEETNSICRNRRMKDGHPHMQDASTSTMERYCDEDVRVARKRSDERLGILEKKREKIRPCNVDRKRRIRRELDADESGDEQYYDIRARKRKKTPVNKVLKLHTLTADLLFQAKRLEQALVAKNELSRELVPIMHCLPDVGAYRKKAADSRRVLRSGSSLKLAGEAPQRKLRQTFKIPGQTRTWSSIETIATPSEGVSKNDHSGVAGGASVTGAPDSNPDLLALNAEISRMARELRMQMMDLWSYRDSTSPESVISDRGDQRPLGKSLSLEDKSEVRRKIFQEAREVFNSISSLRRSQETPSPPLLFEAAKSDAPLILTPNEGSLSSRVIHHPIKEISLQTPPHSVNLSSPSQNRKSTLNSVKYITQVTPQRSPSMSPQNQRSTWSSVRQTDILPLECDEIRDDVSKVPSYTSDVHSRNGNSHKIWTSKEDEFEEIGFVKFENTKGHEPVEVASASRDVVNGKLTLLITDACDSNISMNSQSSEKSLNKSGEKFLRVAEQEKTEIEKKVMIKSNENKFLSDNDALATETFNVTDSDSKDIFKKILEKRQATVEQLTDDSDQIDFERYNDQLLDITSPQTKNYHIKRRTNSSEKEKLTFTNHSSNLLENDYFQSNLGGQDQCETNSFNSNLFSNDDFRTINNNYQDFHSQMTKMKDNSVKVRYDACQHIGTTHDRHNSTDCSTQDGDQHGISEIVETSSNNDLKTTFKRLHSDNVISSTAVAEVSLKPFPTVNVKSSSAITHFSVDAATSDANSSFINDDEYGSTRISESACSKRVKCGSERLSHVIKGTNVDSYCSDNEFILDEMKRLYRPIFDIGTPSTPHTRVLRKDHSQFETEVTESHKQTLKGKLRARRVSDSQVEYHATSNDGVRSNLLTSSASQELCDVIVRTKRTIFTPSDNSHAIPTFLQNNNDNIEPTSTSTSNSIKDVNTITKISSNLEQASDTIIPQTMNGESEANTSPVISTADNFMSLGTTIKSSVDDVKQQSKETKRNSLEAPTPGNISSTVKGMIEQYNKRISERQSLLTSPSKYWSTETSLPNDSKVSITSRDKTVNSIASPYSHISDPSKYMIDGTRSERESPPTTTFDTFLKKNKETVNGKQTKKELFLKGCLPDRNCEGEHSQNVFNTTSESVDSLALCMPPKSVSQPNVNVLENVQSCSKSSKGIGNDLAKEKNEAHSISKSASSAVVQSSSVLVAHPIRPSSTDPTLHSGKYPKRIFKLFKRSRAKDGSDMQTVQKLCRQSLKVDIGEIDKNIKGPLLDETGQIKASNAVDATNDRNVSTLPRVNNESQCSDNHTRSCPSSPVLSHRKRAPSWIVKGKGFLKGRSTSPGVQTRGTK